MSPAGIPTEFQYWAQIDSAPAQRLRRVLRLLFRVDPVLEDRIILDYARSYFDADPVAEAFVQEVMLPRGQTEGRRMVDRALELGVDRVPEAPASLERLFAEVEEKPSWLDSERLALGARVFRRWGTHLYSFAGAITLEGYQENSVTKPLAYTGAYTGESANRRFLETASFWIDISEPGALDRGGRGLATALRVRLMHVFVRKRIMDRPDWDLEAWGVPISQGDALLTLMGGSFLPGYALKLMGYRTSREEIEATLHFWRYVGHLLGVQPRWYPETVEDALGLMFTSQIKSVRRAGTDARHLAQSYLNAYAPTEADRGWQKLVKAWEYRLQLGYLAAFLPASTHRKYQLPSPGVWRLHPMLQAPVIFGRETLRRRSSRFDDWWDQQARRKTKHWVRSRLGERKAEYRAIDPSPGRPRPS